MVGKEGREENGRDGQAGSARDLPRNGRAIGICIGGMVSLRALSVLWSWGLHSGLTFWVRSSARRGCISGGRNVAHLVLALLM
jgi:hypothetical protein